MSGSSSNVTVSLDVIRIEELSAEQLKEIARSISARAEKVNRQIADLRKSQQITHESLKAEVAI